MAKARGDGSMTEVLRRWWIHSSDSTRVQKAAEDTAISSLNARKSRKPKKIEGLACPVSTLWPVLGSKARVDSYDRWYLVLLMI